MDEIDADALADAYNRALDLEKAGRIPEAIDAWRAVLAIDPDDRGGASVRLAALKAGDTPPKAPDAYVALLFDQHAEAFDSILVDQLGYSVPMMVRQVLMEIAPGPYPRMLDLGCGTGLTAIGLDDIAEHITGVDLSEGMLEVADEAEVYDELYAGEAVRFLEEWDEAPFDLVTATDVLPYMGALEVFFREMARCTTGDGVIVFSTETLPDAEMAGRGYMVGARHRFAHAAEYVGDLVKANGFAILLFEEITVRMDESVPVPGHLVVARKG